MLALGLMSGTSVDGVSAALGEFKGHTFRLIGHLTAPYPSEVTRKLHLGTLISLHEVSQLNIEIGNLFGKAANHLLRKTHTKLAKIVCIGSHGQTIYHGPDDPVKNTLQIGDPAIIASKTGIPVVSHFRQGDLAAGGQGAPLIPFF